MLFCRLGNFIQLILRKLLVHVCHKNNQEKVANWFLRRLRLSCRQQTGQIDRSAACFINDNFILLFCSCSGIAGRSSSSENVKRSSSVTVRQQVTPLLRHQQQTCMMMITITRGTSGTLMRKN